MLQGLGLRQLLSLWRKKGARWWNRYFFTVILLTKRITAFFSPPARLPFVLWLHSRAGGLCMTAFVCVCAKESVRFEERGSPLQQLFFRLPYQQLFCFLSLFSHVSSSLSFSFLSSLSPSSISGRSRWLNS